VDVTAVSKQLPVVTGIGAVGWVLPDEWQNTEQDLRRDLREAGWTKAEIDSHIARMDRWEVQVSVKQYADLSDGERVFDPVYLGVGIVVPLGLDETALAEPLRIELEKAFRDEMDLPDDWDTLLGALRRLGIEISLEQLLSLPLTVRLATPDDGPVPLPET
jgi:hypothetical protein